MQLPTSHKTLICELANQVLTITLNRPDRLNAFTLEMADELISVFTNANNDDSIRAIVVTGAGKAFCAGMELSKEDNVFGLNEKLQPTLDEMDNQLENERIKAGVRDTGGQVVLAIYDCKKPVIAAINGSAVGIGATLTCAMDMRLVADDARVGFVFNKIARNAWASSDRFSFDLHIEPVRNLGACCNYLTHEYTKLGSDTFLGTVSHIPANKCSSYYRSYKASDRDMTLHAIMCLLINLSNKADTLRRNNNHKLLHAKAEQYLALGQLAQEQLTDKLPSRS